MRLASLIAICALAGCTFDWNESCRVCGSSSSGTSGSSSSSSGSSSTGSSGSTSSSSSSSSSGGSSGTCPSAPPFALAADSQTPACASATALIPCSAAADAGADGQDGQLVVADSLAHPSSDTTFDPRTNLTWTRSTLDGPSDAGFDLSDALAACAALDAGGFHDWRLPDSIELFSIDDLGAYPHTFEPGDFDVGNGNTRLWSASLTPFSGNAIRVDFYDGEVTYQPLSQQNDVRCVRGGNCGPSARFDADGGFVFDRWTGLTWQSSWPAPANWIGALATCTALGSGWRLANAHELSTLIDTTRSAAPLIDTSVFSLQNSPSTVDPRFTGNTAWSSSPVAFTFTDGGIQGWFVNFDEGTIYRVPIADELNVPCVKDGP